MKQQHYKRYNNEAERFMDELLEDCPDLLTCTIAPDGERLFTTTEKYNNMSPEEIDRRLAESCEVRKRKRQH
jgi:hypothetical protein